MEALAEWAPSVLTLLLLGTAILVPGLIWGWAARFRGPLLLVVAPLLSAALMGVGAVVAGAVGFWWSWPALGLVTAVAAAATWGITTWLPVRAPKSRAPGWVWVEIGLGVAVTAAISAWSMVKALGVPTAPVQTWDGMYHMSAARFVFATGDGSTLHLARIVDPDKTGTAFYPAGWHDWVALGMESGRAAVEASNIASLVVMGVVWPLGVALFAYFLFPKLRLAPFSAALLACATTAFPERLASYGTLWPLMYAYALIPFALSIAVVFFRGRVFAPNWAVLAVLALGLLGIGIVHPQGVLAFLVVGVWLLLGKVVSVLFHPDRATVSGRVLLYASVPTIGLGLVGLRFTSAGQTTLGWSNRAPLGSVESEVRGVILDSQLSAQGYGNEGGFWVLGGLLIVGFVALLVMRAQIWLIPAWLGASYLYLVAATMALPGYSLVGYWYSDAVRLGGIIPLVAVPIMAVGLAWPLSLLFGLVRGTRATAVLEGVLLAVVLAGLYASTGGLGRHVGSHQLWINYVYKGESGLNGLAGEEELEMIARAAETLPEGATVIGSPFMGASLVFSVAGVNSVFKIYAAPESEDLAYVASNFADLETDPRICEILNERGIEYFYYDTVNYRLGETTPPWFWGLENPGALLQDLEVLDAGGGATLYRISPCSVE